MESPTKAKTLGRFLGDGYTIEASMGHLMDLPKSKLGVEVEQHFKPVYEVSEGKSSIIAKITKAANKAAEIYIAPPEPPPEEVPAPLVPLAIIEPLLTNVPVMFSTTSPPPLPPAPLIAPPEPPEPKSFCVVMLP